jgi:hypothetical protein
MIILRAYVKQNPSENVTLLYLYFLFYMMVGLWCCGAKFTYLQMSPTPPCPGLIWLPPTHPQSNPQSIYFPRDETGLVCLPAQLERTLQLYW